ncbi:MAG: dihydrofolate reductase [Candidatus Shapirobacteria bacterium]|nr:dihydrofolate reductase [Candidatus Shapirobacteria bacterium]
MISLIAAVSKNNVIGFNNKIPWNIVEDRIHFKKQTTGHFVVMGRKTFETLKNDLPDRKIIVLTRNKNYKATNAAVCHSWNEIMNLIDTNSEEIFVAGGGEIYSQAINFADKIYITKIDATFEGDTFFPDINNKNWKIVNKDGPYLNQKNNISFEYISWLKKTKSN